LAVRQFGFGFLGRTLAENSAVVLGAELIAKGAGFGFTVFQEHGNHGEHHNDEYERGHDELHIGVGKVHDVLLCGASALAKGGREDPYGNDPMQGNAEKLA
jgi:hypothetical protein